jgi:hypothetical protein
MPGLDRSSLDPALWPESLRDLIPITLDSLPHGCVGQAAMAGTLVLLEVRHVVCSGNGASHGGM